MTNPCFPLRRAFLLLLRLSQFFFSFYIHQSKHLALTLGIIKHIALSRLSMNLYIDFLYKISRWKLKLFANSYIFLCVDSQTLLSWNYYLCELIKYVYHIAFMSLTYYLWKVFCLNDLTWLFIAFLLSTMDNCFVSLHSHPMLYITILITQNYFVITYLLEDE